MYIYIHIYINLYIIFLFIIGVSKHKLYTNCIQPNATSTLLIMILIMIIKTT